MPCFVLPRCLELVEDLPRTEATLRVQTVRPCERRCSGRTWDRRKGRFWDVRDFG